MMIKRPNPHQPIDFRSPDLQRLARRIAGLFPDSDIQAAFLIQGPPALFDIDEAAQPDMESPSMACLDLMIEDADMDVGPHPAQHEERPVPPAPPAPPAGARPAPARRQESPTDMPPANPQIASDLNMNLAHRQKKWLTVPPEDRLKSFRMPTGIEIPPLDPRLASQRVSLQHFSLATRKYMIRFQEQYSSFKIEDFSAEIGINKSYYYRILNCERRPSRDTAIAMAVGLGLTVNEAQDYLLLLGDQLNPEIKRDYLIIECIRRGYSVDQTDSVLTHFDSSPLVNA